MQSNYYAAADCGTNSLHMIIAELKEDGSFRIAAREKEIVRLGKYKDNFFPAEAIEKSIQTITRFKSIADSYNAPLTVVATSAIRHAKNKEEFLNKILQNTGINIRVLSGEEEALLTYKGVTKAFSSSETILCVDIGGGSTEFIIGKEDNIISAKSVELGAVKLTTKFFNEDFSYSKEQIEECYTWTSAEIKKVIPDLRKNSIEKVIGASGTIISAASMITGGNSELNGYILHKDELNRFAEKMFNMTTVDERKTIPGLEPSRADIIPAGIIILKTILDSLTIEEITISTYGLREGVLIENL